MVAHEHFHGRNCYLDEYTLRSSGMFTCGACFFFILILETNAFPTKAYY